MQELAAGPGYLVQIHPSGVLQDEAIKCSGNQIYEVTRNCFSSSFPFMGTHSGSVSEQRDIPELENNPQNPRNLVRAQP